jgi:hypothetical protein
MGEDVCSEVYFFHGVYWDRKIGRKPDLSSTNGVISSALDALQLISEDLDSSQKNNSGGYPFDDHWIKFSRSQP